MWINTFLRCGGKTSSPHQGRPRLGSEQMWRIWKNHQNVTYRECIYPLRQSVLHPHDRSACSLAVLSISISAHFEISGLASSPSNVSQSSSSFSGVLALAPLSRPFPEFPSLLTHVRPRFSHSVAFWSSCFVDIYS